MYDQVVTLIKEKVEPDVFFNQQIKTTEREVFCEEKSIGMREFYAAAQAGLKPVLTLELSDPSDYEGEKSAVYKGIKYSIVKTYIIDSKLDLTLEEKVGER